MSADYTASTASILNLLTLSLDRYWSITSPLKYLGLRTKSRALIMISIAWSLSLLWMLPIIGWPYFFNHGIRHVPEDKCNTEYDKNILFKTTTAIVNFYIPLFAMISINTKIYIVIRKRYHSPIMKYSSVSASLPKSIEPQSNHSNKINRFQSKSSQSSYYAAGDASCQNLYSCSANRFTNNNSNNNRTNKLNNEIKMSRSNSEIQFNIRLNNQNDNDNKNKISYIVSCKSNRKYSLLNCFSSPNSHLDEVFVSTNFSQRDSLNKDNLMNSNNNQNHENKNNDQVSHHKTKINRNQQSVKFNNNISHNNKENSSNNLDINFSLKNSNRSIAGQIRANRNIPSNSLKMSKFLNDPNDQKLSPLFFNKSNSLKLYNNNKSSYFFESDSDSEQNGKDMKKNSSNYNVNQENSNSFTNENMSTNSISKLNINRTNSLNRSRSSIRSNSFKKNETTLNNDSVSQKSSLNRKKITSSNNGKLDLQIDLNSKSKLQQQTKETNNSSSNNRKGFMNKQEKAFKQLAAIVIGFTICFLPYFTIFLVVPFCENCVSDDVFTVSVWLGYLNSTINPFLYALSHKKFFNKTKNKKGPLYTQTNDLKTFTEVRVK